MSETQKLLEQCRFDDVLWRATEALQLDAGKGVLLWRDAGIAAQHLGLPEIAREYMRRFVESGGHVSTGPLVSIVIPTKNRRALLRRAVESVALQLYRPLEVVVVNDAGETVGDILDEFRSVLSVVEVTNRETLYLAASRNAGIEAASGHYIGYLDDDDLLYPHHVGHLVALLGSRGARAAQSTPHLLRDDPSRPGHARLVPYPFRPFAWFDLLVDNVVPVLGILHEASLVPEIGPFDLSLRANEDWEFWIRMRQRTAIEQSPLITSCADQRPGGDRMSDRGLAPFLAAHAAVYRRHKALSLEVGGAELIERQRSFLEDLARRADLEAEQRGRVTIAVAAEGVAEFERAAKSLQVISPHADIVWLDATSPVRHAERLAGLLGEVGLYGLAVVQPDYAEALGPGWLARLTAHLDADPKIVGVAPLDLATADREELAERLGDAPEDSWRFTQERLRWRAALESEPTATIDTGCMLLRRASLTGADPSWRECATIRDQWSLLLAGGAFSIARDVVLLPEEACHKGPVPREGANSPARLPSTAPASPPRIVLAYHRVRQCRSSDPFGLAVEPAVFEEQLTALSERFRLVRAEEFGSQGADSDPRPRVLLTFDDGYRDVYEQAYPLLNQRGVPAVLFVATGCVGGAIPFWWEALERTTLTRGADPAQLAEIQAEWRYLDPEERLARLNSLPGLDAPALRELSSLACSWGMLDEIQRSGTFVIGAHTRHHSSLGRLSGKSLDREIGGSIADLEEHLGIRPDLFAFPHGAPEDLSHEAAQALVRHGFRYGFTMVRGVVPPEALRSPRTPAAMLLPRLPVKNVSARELVGEIEALLPGKGTRSSRTPPAPAPRGRSVVVLSGISAKNLGDDAMLIATVRDLRRLDPRMRIVVLAEDPGLCGGVAAQIDAPILPSPQRFVRAFLGALTAHDRPARAIRELAEIILAERNAIRRGERPPWLDGDTLEGLRELMAADGVVDCGGANLTPLWKTYFYEKCLDYLVAPRPLLVSGQGIDRFEDADDRDLLRDALGRATEVTLREPLSEAYLRQVGCPTRLVTTGDDAITLEPAPAERAVAILARAGHPPESPYLAFQFRHYLDFAEDRFLDQFAAYVDAAHEATGLPVIGVPMHFAGTDERKHLLDVAARVKKPERFHVIREELTPSEAKALFAKANAAFGISYHSAIFALGSGTPYLGLYRGFHYAQKMEGVARLFGERDIAVPVDATRPELLGLLIAAQLADGQGIRRRLLDRRERLAAEVTAARLRFLERIGGGTARVPAPVDWTKLRRLEPVSRKWGFDRGLPIDRFYIERFLERNAGRVRGTVCELLKDEYATRFGGDRVERLEILDIDPSNRRATLVEDLTRPQRLGERIFDCFILTQTLPYIYDCGGALRTAYQALKENGTLLVTVPSIIKYHREPEDHWRFTPDSMRRLIEETCPGADFEVEAHGNLLAAVSFLHGIAVEDLEESELGVSDPEYPIVVTARITRGRAPEKELAAAHLSAEVRP